MEFNPPSIKDQSQFDAAATHPLQSWAWGDFRQKTGVRVERIFDGESSLQVTFHSLPKLPLTIGYLPKSTMPTLKVLSALKTLGQKHRAIFIKLEPNTSSNLHQNRQFLIDNGCKPGRPMFTNYSFLLDLNSDEKTLFNRFRSRTRYNIRLAQKRGVTVSIDNSQSAFEDYLKLWKETTTRQNFYSHDEGYHRLMWQTMRKANIAHLLKATYGSQTLVSWILFKFNSILYYPYGSSSSKYREFMASNLVMWEAIRFGLKEKCQVFDMWGSLGPNPDQSDPWYGFHRFKEGYAGQLTEFVGSYDLVLKPTLYQPYRTAESLRWWLLRRR